MRYIRSFHALFIVETLNAEFSIQELQLHDALLKGDEAHVCVRG